MLAAIRVFAGMDVLYALKKIADQMGARVCLTPDGKTIAIIVSVEIAANQCAPRCCAHVPLIVTFLLLSWMGLSVKVSNGSGHLTVQPVSARVLFMGDVEVQLISLIQNSIV